MEELSRTHSPHPRISILLYGIAFVLSSLSFATPLSLAAPTREVVLLGKAQKLNIVITRAVQVASQEAESAIERYPLYSLSRDGLKNLKIELWGETYLLGICQAIPLKGQLDRRNLVVDMRCRGPEEVETVHSARLKWVKANGRPTLRFESWLSGPRSVDVEVEYDGIGG